MTTRCEQVFATAHAKLLRAAYVVAAGERDRAARWSRAHQLVAASLPLRVNVSGDEDEVYQVLLCRVFKRALRQRRRLPWHGWGRASTPAGGADHVAVDEALSRAPAPVRAAYLLIVGEQRPNKTVVDLLSRSGVAQTAQAVRAAQKLAMELVNGGNGLSLDRQQEVLESTTMNPKAAWLRPPAPLAVRGWRVLRWAAVVAAAIAVVVAVARPSSPVATAARAATDVTVRKVDAQAWRNAALPTLGSWPARGSQIDDAMLVNAAARTWTMSRSPQLLFAGELGGDRQVVLTDGRWIGHYSEKSRMVETTAIPSDDVYGTSLVRLGGGRYLVAPWVAQLQAATMGGNLRAVQIVDGVTETVDVRASGVACDVGTVLRVTARDIAHDSPFTLGDVGKGEPAHLMYLPVELPAGIERPHEQDATGGPVAFESASCRWGELVKSPLRSLTVWEFYAGVLPEGGVAAKWLCARGDRIDESNATSVLLATGDATTTKAVATTLDSRLCSRLSRDVVAVTWWQAPSGRWHLVAAGSRLVDRITVTVDGRSKTGRGSVSVGPFATPVAVASITGTRSGAAVPVIGPAPA